jgi:tetratricopeptide (TPR) repeat protein
LCLAAPAAAQRGTSPVAPPASTAQKTNGPDIVVNGIVDKKRGTWRRAESDHLIVVSKGSVDELTRVTKNLERLYHLMSRLYRAGNQSDSTVKLHVTVIDSTADFRAMGLRNLRSQEGPFSTAFSDQTYYDPREDGDILAVARGDQIIELNTSRAHNLDCDDVLAGGLDAGAAGCGTKSIPYHPPATRTWEQLLYSAFARHFIQTYDPVAFPRWYLDGIGALFSTIAVRNNGAIDYAAPPENYQQAIRSYGDLNVGDVLTGRYLDADPKKMGWTPYHAWLLTHFFVFSDLKPERRKQFRDYMTAIHQGEPMAEAAQVFGNMGTLQREVSKYVLADKRQARTEPPQARTPDPVITTLSLSDAALVEARIELGTRLATPSEDAGSVTNAVGPTQAQLREGWIAQLRDTVARLPYDADAASFAAEAECRAGQTVECLADAERILANSPDDVRALTWKGVALTDQAVTGSAADRSVKLAEARKTIERAIRIDSEAAPSLIAYFQSFTKAGEEVPDQALEGMAKVIRSVPAAPGPRLYLAEELLRRGKADIARRVASAVLYGGYDSPEKTTAQALFPPAASALPVGR